MEKQLKIQDQLNLSSEIKNQYDIIKNFMQSNNIEIESKNRGILVGKIMFLPGIILTDAAKKEFLRDNNKGGVVCLEDNEEFNLKKGDYIIVNYETKYDYNLIHPLDKTTEIFLGIVNVNMIVAKINYRGESKIIN